MTILLSDLHVWPWLQITWTSISNKQLCQIILKSMHKCRSYSLDKLNLWPFIIWPSNVTLIFNLHKLKCQIPLLNFKDNNCATLFWNPCINVQLVARTSSVYDNFIIWPSSVTLTFNLPEQMFQMALLLLKDNNCAKWFWNPGLFMHKCISYSPDKLNLWPFYHLTFKCDLYLQFS